MTGDHKFDLDAILGPDADPERRARLAALLSDALADEHEVIAPDTATIAAYLDRGLTDSEMLSFQMDLCKSAVSRADMESAADLLAMVENATQQPPRAIMRHAREVMMAAAAQIRPQPSYQVAAAAASAGPGDRMAAAAARPRPRPTLWQRLSEPRVKIGLGVAFAAAVAVIVWNAETGTMTSQVGSRSGTLIEGNHATSSTPTPSPQTWGAIAVSSGAGVVYGVSHGAPTEREATAMALLDCNVHHGVNCRVAAAGQGQCFALASQAGGRPVAAAATSFNEVRRRATEACNTAQKSSASCIIVEAFCSGP